MDVNYHLATIIGPEDNRETFSEYSTKRNLDLKDVHSKYSATGVFHCGGLSSSANVVSKNNRIALAGHQFFNRGTCDKKMNGDFSNCYFETIVPPGYTPAQYKIKPETLTLGSKCPGVHASEDWAVVDLQSDVKNVQAYGVANVNQMASAKDDYEDLIDQKITTIAARNDNFKDHPFETPTLCDGNIGGIQGRKVGNNPREFFIASNCSYGNGTSGGGLVLQSGNVPTLIGVVSGGRGKDYEPFGPGNFSSAALVQGRFYSAITKK